jgi:drug/metabolite transporter (DMT)-like permease
MISFILTLLMFSSLEPVSKMIISDVDPLLITLYRFSIGVLALAGYAIYTKQYKEIQKLKIKDYRQLAIIGFINITISMVLLQYSIKHTTASMAASITSSNPLFAFIIAVLIGQEVFNYKKTTAILIGILGIQVIMFHDGIRLNLGAIYAILSAITFALYYVLGKESLKDKSPVVANIFSFIFGVVFLAIYIKLFKGMDLFISKSVFEMHWIKILYLGFFNTGLGYLCFFITLQRYSTVSSSFILLFKPFVATILSMILLGEKLTVYFVIGLLLLSTGSLILTWDKWHIIKKRLIN